MAYEIVMPQLSDSMDEGKLISWKIKEGDFVKKGDVIAEVESDKAIMEVQSFKDGKVKSIKAKEGENIPVGTVIAVIETDSESKPDSSSKDSHSQEGKEKIVQPVQKEKEDIPKPSSFIDEILGTDENDTSPPQPKTNKADASPKAKAVAATYGIDIQKLQKQNIIPIPAHEDDIKEYHLKRYFTPKALELLKLYHLDPSIFDEDKKHNSEDILSYIKDHDIPLAKKIEPFQKALIETVTNAAKKPVFHIYDSIDATLLKEKKEHSVTVWLMVIFAKALMKHEEFRSTFKENTIQVWSNVSISLAVAHKNYLYMPVFKDINKMTPSQIHSQLEEFEQKARNRTLSAADMQGSNFGISNLGMLGIERFDAMINKNDSAIAAIGGLKDTKISITLTIDHRIINGYQAAEFMQTLKEIALNPHSFKE